MSVSFSKKTEFSRSKLEELLKKRFFFAQAFGIYGGVGGLYDYGPPGCALQANLVSLWRSHFILEENMLEVDCTALTPHEVLKTSGHVDRFTDYMVKDAITGDVYRADHLLKASLEKKLKDASPGESSNIENVLAQIDNYSEVEIQGLFQRYNVKSDLGNPLGPVHKFNLMFSTSIGPAGTVPAYLRPETAQGQFVNFKRLLEFNNDRMPFASAMIGKSFRNEISPRSGLLRVREFLMAEIEHYVHPDCKNHPRFAEVAHVELNFLPAAVQEQGKSTTARMNIKDAVESGMVNNETLGYFLARTALFLSKIGIDPERLRFRQHLRNEMAHYASDCWDAEINNSYGWIECVGCADRSCYDLSMHSKTTGEKLVARERLSEPIKVLVNKIVVDKKSLGITFKGDAKEITETIESLTEEEVVDLFSKVSDDLIPISTNSGKSFKIPISIARLEEVESIKHVLEYIPAVIEPSFGIGRIIYSLLEHSFWAREGDEQRAVLSLPVSIAPLKCLIAPLSPNPELRLFCTEILKALRKRNISSQIDESSTSIGKKYSRYDEIGVPFAVTVDFQTLKDNSVTIRERDSTEQSRLPLEELGKSLTDMVEGSLSWDELVRNYGAFTSQII